MAEEEKKHNVKKVKKYEERRNIRNKKENKVEGASVKKRTVVKKPFHSAKKENVIVKEKLEQKKFNKELHEKKHFEERAKVKSSSNRTSTLVIAAVMVILIIFLIVLGIKSFSSSCDPNGIIAVGPFGSEEEPVANTGDIIRTQEAYDKIFNYSGKCKPDFEEHSYAVIVVNYDTCQKKDLKVKEFKLDKDSLTLYMSYNGKCNTCELKYTYYLVPVPLTTDKLDITVDYERTNELTCVMKVN